MALLSRISQSLRPRSPAVSSADRRGSRARRRATVRVRASGGRGRDAAAADPRPHHRRPLGSRGTRAGARVPPARSTSPPEATGPAPTAPSTGTTWSVRFSARARRATTSGRCGSTASARAAERARRRCIRATTSCGSTASPTRTSTARTIRFAWECPRAPASAASSAARCRSSTAAGHGSPVAGAAVNGPGAAAVSGSRGGVRIVPHRAGEITLQAAKSGATASDPVTICVYRHLPSECGSALAGPRVHVMGIREHQVFRLGPRQLRGTAGPDVAGLIDVSLGLLRHTPSGRCSYYDGQRAAWRGIVCSARPPRFSIGAAADWSYLLPGPSGRGALSADRDRTRWRRPADQAPKRAPRRSTSR